jgi:hypothetical protein
MSGWVIDRGDRLVLVLRDGSDEPPAIMRVRVGGRVIAVPRISNHPRIDGAIRARTAATDQGWRAIILPAASLPPGTDRVLIVEFDWPASGSRPVRTVTTIVHLDDGRGR